jgi:DNA polymerase III alpha subunit (gram-positive type)
MEKYLSPNGLPLLQKLSKILNRPLTFVDLETTGLVHESNFSIIEIGIITITPTNVIEKSSLVDPRRIIPSYITDITHITNEMVKGKPTFSHFNKYFKQVAHKDILMGFNSRPFDSKGIEKMARKQGEVYSFQNQIDIRQVFLRERNSRLNIRSHAGKLTEASEFYNVSLKVQAHRAAYDIALTALLAENILKDSPLACLSKDIDKFECEQSKKMFYKHAHYSLKDLLK